METFRKILDFIFMVLFIGGIIFLIILLIGGAFPVDMGTVSTKTKFDIARLGWEPNSPNTLLLITHEKDDFKEGWGGLHMKYKYNKGELPGVHCESYSMSGLVYVRFWMKAKKPSKWQLRVQRKSDDKICHYTFITEKDWTDYEISLMDIKAETGIEGKFSETDLKPWIALVDVSSYSTGENEVWLDELEIQR